MNVSGLPTRMRRQPRIARGFTMIELMIGMGLGLVLLGGMITVFIGNRHSADLNGAMVDMQESARFALDAIARDARMAGFQGCVNINSASANVLAVGAPTSNLFESAMTGSRVVSATSWDPAPPITFTIPTAGITPVVGSDVLSVQFGNADTFRLLPMAELNEDIVLTQAAPTIEPKDLVIISNCQIADLVRISAINGATLKHDSTDNTSNNLSARYGQGGEVNMPRVMKFESNIYFIADTGRTNEAGDAIQALYRQTLPYTDPPQEMVEGVEQFRLKYGIRIAGSNDLRWATAVQAAGNFERVEALQIGLLLSSYDRITQNPDNRTYLIAGDLIAPSGSGGTTTHPADRRFRLAFNTTIKIRNRR